MMRVILLFCVLTISLFSVAGKSFTVKVTVLSYDGMPLKNIAVKTQMGGKIVGNVTDLNGVCLLVTDQKSFSVNASDESENYHSTSVYITLKKAQNTIVRIVMYPGEKLNVERVKLDDLNYGIVDSTVAHPCDDSVFVEAQFPGGRAGLMKFLMENIRYPQVSLENGDMGKVYLSFIVELDGNLSHIMVVRGVTQELDQEAKRVFLDTPKWIPATCNGTSVRSKYTLPINFNLQ
jgi:TonB family protein